LTNVTLYCFATATDGSSVTVTSYRWTATNCQDCFYNGSPTRQIISGTDLLAKDAGSVSCNTTIGGANYASDPLTLRISGEL